MTPPNGTAAPTGTVAALLHRLAPDQRAAATTPPGSVLCIAPAGSGKTTTLVARIAWLVDGGADPASIAAIAFNRRAAEELTERIDLVLRGFGVAAGTLRVRTFHALGREILREAGLPVEPLADRDAVLARIRPGWSPSERRRLDTAISRLKLDLRADPEAVAADLAAGPLARAFVDYERALVEDAALDFDDLVAGALRLLERSPEQLARWRARAAHLLVDEAQDLDRSQLDLALLLAAPANRIFLVGDDDQSIYGWRLADVRRVIGLAASLPGLRRVDLTVNYRCPAPVVERAVRLVEHNRERFAKVVRPGPAATGRLILAGTAASTVRRVAMVLASWAGSAASGDPTFAILARTNRELEPAAVGCVEAGVAFRARELRLIVESPFVDELLDRADADGQPEAPLLIRLGALRTARPRPDDEAADDPADDPPVDPTDDPADDPAEADVLDALLGWAAAFPDLAALHAAVAAFRERLAQLRSDDAALSLATAHGTKGLEFDHVAVLMDASSFPSRRSISESIEPERALEEERRLAYVAWTRARRSLTLVYDPGAPSSFLLEAFSPAELGARAR